MSEGPHERARSFPWLLLLPLAHPWLTLAIAGLISVLAAMGTTRLRGNGSLAAMFPSHDPAADALVHVLDDFPAADQLIVLASLPPNASQPDPSRLIEFGHRFINAVHASPAMDRLTDGVFDSPDADTRAFVEKVIGPSAIFYLDRSTFAAAQKRLSFDEMRRQLKRDRTILAAPGPGAALAAVARTDPLGLHDFIANRLSGQRPFRTYQNGDEFVSPDGRSLLIRVIGRESPNDLDYSRKLTEAVTSLAERANSDGLRLEYTGSYPIAARAEQAIRRDMIGSTIGSVFLLQALFLLVYRSPFKLFALAFGPVALGILMGFGLLGIISHSLTPLTAVLGAILAGMGIDYSIQYLSYYESRRAIGSGPRRAAEETVAEMSPAVLAAWATSVIGFLAIGCSTVAALRQFALLGTLGLTGAFLCAAMVLPLILMLTDSRPTPAPSRLRFGMERPLLALGRSRFAWLSVSAVVAIVAMIVLVRSRGDILPLDPNLTVMHPRPNPAIDAEYHVEQAFGISPSSLVIYLRANDPRKLVELACDVSNRLKTVPGVNGTVGLTNVLPDPRSVLARLTEMSAIDPDRVVSDFRRACDEVGFAPTAFEGYAGFLRLLLTQRHVPDIRDVLDYRRLAETMLPASAFKNGNANEAITLVFMRQPLDQDRASRDAAIASVRNALSGMDGATVTGLGVIGHDAEQAIHVELPRLLLAAVVLVALYLAIHFRNVADALLSLTPAVFGMLVAAALLRIAGQKLNMINLVAVPLLIGIDVDYGIFLVTLSRFRRVRQLNAPALARQISPAMHAVIFCATATLLGYVSLVWTSVPAERSLGIAAAVGIGTCLAGATFLLVPIFFSLARRPTDPL